jgi:hypothetical protein
VPLVLSGQERFQISGDNFIERTLFRIARPVYDADGHEGIAVCNRQRIRLHNRDNNLHGPYGKIRLDRDNIIAFVSSLSTSTATPVRCPFLGGVNRNQGSFRELILLPQQAVQITLTDAQTACGLLSISSGFLHHLMGGPPSWPVLRLYRPCH